MASLDDFTEEENEELQHALRQLISIYGSGNVFSMWAGEAALADGYPFVRRMLKVAVDLIDSGHLKELH